MLEFDITKCKNNVEDAKEPAKLNQKNNQIYFNELWKYENLGKEKISTWHCWIFSQSLDDKRSPRRASVRSCKIWVIVIVKGGSKVPPYFVGFHNTAFEELKESS